MYVVSAMCGVLACLSGVCRVSCARGRAREINRRKTKKLLERARPSPARVHGVRDWSPGGAHGPDARWPSGPRCRLAARGDVNFQSLSVTGTSVRFYFLALAHARPIDQDARRSTLYHKHRPLAWQSSGHSRNAFAIATRPSQCA